MDEWFGVSIAIWNLDWNWNELDLGCILAGFGLGGLDWWMVGRRDGGTEGGGYCGVTLRREERAGGREELGFWLRRKIRLLHCDFENRV